MTIYLVRHTDYANPQNIFPFDLPVYLSTEGRDHAKRIGKWLQNKKGPIPIYSSPVVRTVQTAEIIASQTQSQVEIDTRLTEASCEKLKGTQKPKRDAWKVEYDFSLKESIQSIHQRLVESFLDKVMKGDDCTIVSHGDPLTILFYYLKKAPRLEDFYKPNATEEYIKKGEIIEVMVQNKSYIINRITV